MVDKNDVTEKRNALMISQAQLATVQALKIYFPAASERFLARCVKAGVNQENVQEIQDLIQTYGTKLPAIINWLEGGLDLEKIHDYLDLRAVYPRASVDKLAEIDQATGFQIASLDELLAAFAQLLNDAKIHFPVHQLVHFVNDGLNGDYQLAYQMACDRPEKFVALVKGEIDLLEFNRSEIPWEDLGSLEEG